MEKKKNLEIGTLLVKTRENGSKNVFLALGNKGAKEQYNVSVEIIVRDNNNNVIHQQTDGFVNLQDPRTLPDELLKLKFIDEAKAEKMKENALRIPESVKYKLIVR